MMPTESCYTEWSFIISLVTNVRPASTGNQRPLLHRRWPPTHRKIGADQQFFKGFGVFFAMDLSSKSLAQDRKYLKYDKIQQLTQVCLKLGLHLSDLSGTTSRPSLSRDDAPSVTGTPWYNPCLHIPFRFFNKATRACTQHQHPELRTY